MANSLRHFFSSLPLSGVALAGIVALLMSIAATAAAAQDHYRVYPVSGDPYTRCFVRTSHR